MPDRIQLSRKRGWRLPDGAAVVSRPSRWGNPYRIGHAWPVLFTGDIPAKAIIETQTDAVSAYRAWIEFYLACEPVVMRSELDKLRGRDLACWCHIGTPCHADVLLDLANR